MFVNQWLMRAPDYFGIIQSEDLQQRFDLRRFKWTSSQEKSDFPQPAAAVARLPKGTQDENQAQEIGPPSLPRHC